MAMTTCRECSGSVSDSAPACPACGAVRPGARIPTESEARARREREKLWTNRVMLAVGVPVLIVLVVAVYRASTGGETVDAAARQACAAVAREDSMPAVAAAQQSEVGSLRRAAESTPPAGENSLEWRFARVAQWCDEND